MAFGQPTMSVFPVLGFILCIASWSVADITVQTSHGRPVSLSKLGIDIHEVTELRFSLQTCTYGYVSLKNTNSTSADLQVVFNYRYTWYLYTAISVACHDACNGDSTTLDYQLGDLSLCQKQVELWTSWSNGSFKAGTIKKGSKNTLVSTFEVIPFADVFVGTNSSINDTWILHVDVPSTTTTTIITAPVTTEAATTITTTATTVAKATTTEPTKSLGSIKQPDHENVTDTGNHTLPWTKEDNSTNITLSTDISGKDTVEEILGSLFKSASGTLGSLTLMSIIFLPFADILF